MKDLMSLPLIKDLKILGMVYTKSSEITGKEEIRVGPPGGYQFHFYGESLLTLPFYQLLGQLVRDPIDRIFSFAQEFDRYTWDYNMAEVILYLVKKRMLREEMSHTYEESK